MPPAVAAAVVNISPPPPTVWLFWNSETMRLRLVALSCAITGKAPKSPATRNRMLAILWVFLNIFVLLCLDSVSCYLPAITRGIPTRTHRTDRHPSRFAELLCFRWTLPNIERKQKPDYQRWSNTTICGQIGCLCILQRLGIFW